MPNRCLFARHLQRSHTLKPSPSRGLARANAALTTGRLFFQFDGGSWLLRVWSIAMVMELPAPPGHRVIATNTLLRRYDKSAPDNR
jgi:hypothetical protein